MITQSYSQGNHIKENNTNTNSNQANSYYQQESNSEDVLLKVKGVISKTLSIFETLISQVIGRLYISYDSSPLFEYTNLEGIICLVINRKSSILLLQIYDLLDIKKEFEIELYQNIYEGYHVMTDTFHSIEYPTFFLGINFATIPFASLFKDSLFVHSMILDSDKNQFCYKQEIKDPQRQLKIGLIEDLVQLNFNRHNGDLIYDISKEATNYMEKMGVGVAKMNTEYENIRGEIRFRKLEGKVNKSEVAEVNLNKMISLMSEFANQNKEEEREEIEELSLLNKVNKKYKTEKNIGKTIFQKENDEKNHHKVEETERKDYPKRRTEKTNFNALMMPKTTQSHKSEKQ